VERGEQIVVGVNKFVEEDEHKPENMLRVDPAVQEAQIQRLQALRQSRDSARVADVLARLERAARDPNAPLMPLFIEAVEAYATLGEIFGVLRKVFGEYEAVISI